MYMLTGRLVWVVMGVLWGMVPNNALDPRNEFLYSSLHEKTDREKKSVSILI